MNYEAANWDPILNDDLWLPTDIIHDIVKKRPEFNPEAVIDEDQAAAVKKLRPFFKKITIVEEPENLSSPC